VRFGKPLDFSRYYGLEADRIVLRAVTDEIIYAIMKLSGQEYVDEYAQRHKARKSTSRRGAAEDVAEDADDADEADVISDADVTADASLTPATRSPRPAAASPDTRP